MVHPVLQAGTPRLAKGRTPRLTHSHEMRRGLARRCAAALSPPPRPLSPLLSPRSPLGRSRCWGLRVRRARFRSQLWHFQVLRWAVGWLYQHPTCKMGKKPLSQGVQVKGIPLGWARDRTWQAKLLTAWEPQRSHGGLGGLRPEGACG